MAVKTQGECSGCHRTATLSRGFDVIDLWNGRALDRETYSYISDEELCVHCHIKMERKFIMKMPLEDLPLYVSHMWVFTESEAVYLKRLESGR